MVKLCLEGRAERAGHHNECSLSSLLLHCLSPPWALIVLYWIVPGIVCVNNLVSHSHPRVSYSIPKHCTVSNFKDLLCMVLLLTRGPISRMPALLWEGEGVLFASQICEAPEAAKGVQGATRLIMLGKFHGQVNILYIHNRLVCAWIVIAYKIKG